MSRQSVTQTTFMSWEDAVNWLIAQPDRREFVEQCYFDRPVRRAVDRYANGEEWSAIRKYLPDSPGFALDIGAGNGLVSYALANDSWQVTALEPDPSEFVGAGAIRAIAAGESLPICVVEEVGESMPFANNQFDLVTARQVAHHASNLTQMVREMARVLKPGGTLIMFRDHLVDSQAELEEFQRNHPLHDLYGGENAFRLAQYRSALKAAGLSIRHELHQFDSVINFAPHTKASLCSEVASRFRPAPLRPLIQSILTQPWVFKVAGRIASKCYRKPGRLVSFICRLDGEEQT